MTSICIQSGVVLPSIAEQKKRLSEILDSDQFERIVEKDVSNRRGTVYLPECAGKTVFVVIVDSGSKRKPANGKKADQQ